MCHKYVLLIEEEDKWLYVLIKDFNTFMYDHILHRGKNIFAVIDYKLLVQKKMLKFHVKDCFKTNGKQMIKMPKKVNMLDSKIMKEK